MPYTNARYMPYAADSIDAGLHRLECAETVHAATKWNVPNRYSKRLVAVARRCYALCMARKPTAKQISAVMSALARKGLGSKRPGAGSAALTPDQRRERAQLAARARWAKPDQPLPAPVPGAPAPPADTSQSSQPAPEPCAPLTLDDLGID